jgi:transposase
MKELQLTRGQRRRLQRQLRQTRDARVHRRTLAILEYSQGRPIAQIARMLRVVRQSVYNWIQAYAQDHDPTALDEQERSGRPSVWTKNLRKRFRALLEQAPDQLGYFAVNWTVPLLQEEVERRTEQRVSEDTVRRELARLNYVWKRGRYVLDPDPQREKKTRPWSLGRALAAPERLAGGG